MPAEQQEIERLYIEGQDLVAEGDFVGAAEAWTKLFALLPESPTNTATRENIVLNVIDAYLNAYNRLVDDAGEKQIEHLHRAREVIDAYRAEFAAAYGDGRAMSVAVTQKIDELDAALHRAEVGPEYGCLSPCLQPCLSPCLQPLCLSPVQERGCGSKDPAAAFVVLGALGLGLRRRRDVIERVAGSLPADVVAKLRAKLDDE